MAAWVLLRHELPDGSWHHDWMIEDHASQDGRLITFRLGPEVAWPPRGPFVATRLAAHRREYLDYEGPVSGGRGVVSRVASGSCEIGGGQGVLVIEFGPTRLTGRAGGPVGAEQTWAFEPAAGDLEAKPR